MLKDHGYEIAPSTYYAGRNRPPSKRQQSDERLLPLIKQIHEDNYSCYGARKIWHELTKPALNECVGRDQVARLMRLIGLQGKSRRGRVVKTTIPGRKDDRFPDLVNREWDQGAPDLVWISDFTYVKTRSGMVYVSFVQDAGTRSILGFTVQTSMTTDLVMKSLLQALSVRRRGDALFTAEGIIHHSDAGSQYTSLAFSQKLLAHEISGSVGSIGTAHDNAMMESTIGLYKTELVYAQPSWADRQEVETSTTAWVAWFNKQRSHSSLGYLSPLEFEVAYNQN